VGVINVTNVFLARLIVNIATTIISFIIAVMAQYLIINSLLNPNLKFSSNFKNIKKFFRNLFCLTLIINVIFLIVTLPIYVAVFLISLDKIAIAMIALIMGLILSLLTTCYLVFSPFLIIDEQQPCLKAIVISFNLSAKKIANLILNIIVLALIIIILNSLGLLLYKIQYAGLFISSLIYLLMIIFAFNYLFALYQNYKLEK
jgi:hypothetical protein